MAMAPDNPSVAHGESNGHAESTSTGEMGPAATADPTSTPHLRTNTSPALTSTPVQPAYPSPSPAPRTRTLRNRASLPAPRPKMPSGAPLSEAEIANIKRRLGPETVAARREELARDKERALRDTMDGHDTAVREKFHLERFTTIVTGWDPAMAKQDNSPVFLDYVRANHNLWDLVPHDLNSSNARAGPSRPRASLPSRQTRRQAHEQIEMFAVAVAAPDPAPAPTPAVLVAPTPGIPVSGRKKGVAISGSEEEIAGASFTVMSKGKGKGKARASMLDVDATSVLVVDMPPPALPLPGGKKGRRQTLGLDPALTPGAMSTVAGGKRGRASLPSHMDAGPSASPQPESQSGAVIPQKRGRPRKSLIPNESPSTHASPAEPLPKSEAEPEAEAAAAASPTPLPPPAPLPSLSHLAFDPPPKRKWKRHTGATFLVHTDPEQKLYPGPRFSGDLAALLESYTHIEDAAPADMRQLEQRAERDGFLMNRINWLRGQGRLQWLLSEDPLAPGAVRSGAKAHVPARQQDHRDALMLHMTQVRNAMMSEAKSKPVVCRKIARMIMAHWEHLEGREEREAAAMERELKRRGKEVVKALRKKWGMAVKVVRAKVAAEQKAEQDRLGKEHLQNMLQRSTGLLEAQQDYDMEGQGEEDDDDDDENDDGDDDDESHDGEGDDGARSDGTADVSAADDSDAPDDDNDENDTKDGDDNEDESEREGEEEEAGAHLALLLGNDADPRESREGSAHRQPSERMTERAGAAGTSQIERKVDPGPGDAMEVDGDVPGEAPVQELPAAAAQVTTPAEIAAPGQDFALQVISPSKTGAEAESTADVNDTGASISRDPVESAESANATGANGNPGAEPIVTVNEPDASIPVIRSRRARGVVSLAKAETTEDPDANDVEFAVKAGSDADEEDHALDVEMEEGDEGVSGTDSEDEGLLADAEMPIEELLRRYGYGARVTDAAAATDISEGHEANGDAGSVDVDMDAGADEVKVDKSLTDERLGNQPSSPTLIVDGKRQRRARQVWTPEHQAPQVLKKPKIEVVEPDSEEEEEEEEDEEESEDVEGSEEGDDAGDEDDTTKTVVEEDPNAPKVHVPFLLRGTLRPYQHAGLDWLASLYANNMNGILADEMGLGKTIQTISLLAHLACDRGVWGQHLIIVPTSVILNWEMEFKKFLPGFKVLTYYGNQKERKEKRVGWHTEHAWQVCITSYQIVLADQHIFRRKNWCYMILDEAHNIKNFRSQRWQTLLGFKAQRRLLLTGTPLQNNLMELWSLLYFLMPHGVAEEATAVVGFANHKNFMEWFSNPMDKAVESGDTLDEETLATVNKLQTLLRPFILRRLKSEVETQLPGKFEHVVYCRLSKRQRFLYDEFMSRSSTHEALTSGGYLGVMNTLMQLRKVCNHPDLFEVRPVRTSFAMDPVARGFTPTELLVRRRLLREQDEAVGDVPGRGLLELGLGGWSGWAAYAIQQLEATRHMPGGLARKGRQPAPPKQDARTTEGWLKYRAWLEGEASVARWRGMREANSRRCRGSPVFGSTMLDMVTGLPRLLPLTALATRRDLVDGSPRPAGPMILSLAERAESTRHLVERFAVVPPNAVARDLASMAIPSPLPPQVTDADDTLHHAATKLQIAFPDASLLQYDCGKLQKLYEMLRDLKAGGHRVLIFTQMTRVLDILEMFLSFNGHRYLRLDGSTKIEDRQVITERFNSDPRVFCFIASSRSGGVGINLTGADTVFFYDSDWNPSMDRQCMDRAHRIGQTREVHIYRFVSSHTVEENMLKKANQKRLLDRVVIQEGDFTTEFFGRVDWRDVVGAGLKSGGGEQGEGAEVREVLGNDVDEDEEKEGIEDVAVEAEPEAEDVEHEAPRRGEEREFARMVAQVEDEEDVLAANVALGEGEMDMGDFGGGASGGAGAGAGVGGGRAKEPVGKGKGKSARFEQGGSATPASAGRDGAEGDLGDGVEEADGAEDEGDEEEEDVGGVDEYMLRLVEWDWDWFVSWR